MTTFDDRINTQKPRRRHWARKTHRVVAISALVFLIIITVTGLALNHADALGLSQKYAPSALVEQLYGIDTPSIDDAFEASGIVFATVANTLYSNTKVLASDTGRIRGAVASIDEIVVATDRDWLVISKRAELVERLATEPQRLPIRIGSDGRRVVIETRDRYYALDPLQMELAPIDALASGIEWSKPLTPTDERLLPIDAAAAGQLLRWERLLVDLHSGRILPVVGRYVADLASLCLLYLCATGLVLWFRKR